MESQRATSASTSRNHTARESALTATGSSTAVAAVSAWLASSYSSRVCRPSRTSHSPCGVGRHGVPRLISTWPVADSRARIRWLTALGVMCSRRAAASKDPVIGDGHQRVELGRVEVHQASEAQLMDHKKLSFAFICESAYRRDRA